jgi:hypothetical protein
VDVPVADTGLRDQDRDEKVQRQLESSAAFLARTCDRCGASPCQVFGATTTFCTLECWQASHVAQ